MEVLATINLIPEQLHAYVYKTTFSERRGEVSCWVCVSRGLAKVGQRELVFSLKREPYEREDDVPTVPLQWFMLVHRLASEGRLVEQGGLTELPSPGLFPDDGVKGVIYETIQSVENFHELDIEPDTLAVIPLLSEEIEAFKWCGPARVLALLGKYYRYYPYPQWHDRRRPSVIDFAAHKRHSILTKVSSIYVPYVDIYCHKPTVALRVPQDRAGDLNESLATVPDGQAFALLTSPSSFGDAALVWQPGQSGPEAIAPEGIVRDFRGDQAIGGSFLVVAPGVPERAVSMLEDGFGLAMPEREWAHFRNALKDVNPFAVQGEGRSIVSEFVIQWYEPRYRSPFGDAFYAPGGFRTYTPRYGEEIDDAAIETEPSEETTAAPGETASIEKVILLQSQEEMGERVSSEELAAFVHLVTLIVNDHLTVRTANSEKLILEFNLSPGQGELSMLAHGKCDNTLIQNLCDRLSTISPPEDLSGTVRFQLHLRLAKEGIGGAA